MMQTMLLLLGALAQIFSVLENSTLQRVNGGISFDKRTISMMLFIG
jgi:hypothetical protein